MKIQNATKNAFSIGLLLTIVFLASAIVRAQPDAPFIETALPGSAYSGVVPAPNGRLYGVTYDGGSFNAGTIYSVDPALSSVTVHHNFNGSGDGQAPYDELVYDPASGKFYGTTSTGGASGAGTIFSFDPGNNAVIVLNSYFNGYAQPQGPLVVLNGYLYGTLAYSNGAIFRTGINGDADVDILHNFTAFASFPYALTRGADGMLYGVTRAGGLNCFPTVPTETCGMVYRLNAALPGEIPLVETLYQVDEPFNRGLQRKLVYGSDGLLYFNNHARIFRIDPQNPTATFRMVHIESGADTSMSIIEGADNRIYAASYGSGSAGLGRIFSINKNDFTDKKNIRNFSFANGSGANGPYGILFRTSGGDIYGTSEYTAASPFVGTVFRISDRNLASNQFILSSSADGTAPITVDDDLDIYQNGVLIYTDGNRPAGYRFPIAITANPGDTLRFVVRDTYGVCAQFSPIYLTDSLGTGTLIDAGFNLGCGRPNTDQGVVHDFLYTLGNAPPVLSNVAVTSPINENSAAILSGNISDANFADSLTLTVNWGDGSAPQIVLYPAGTTFFSVIHTYADDNPTSTPSDNYTISLTLSDGSLSNTGSATVTVNNVVPVLTNVGLNPATIIVGSSTTLIGSVRDVGTSDTKRIVINWGDGSANTTVNLAAIVGAFIESHQYNTSGNFNITVTATDDDGGSVSANLNLTVNPLLPAAPTNLTAIPVSATQINLSWTDNAHNEDGFVIERCEGNGRCTNFVQIGQTNANVATFSDVALTSGTNYFYRVRAFNTGGNSAFSTTEKAKTARR